MTADNLVLAIDQGSSSTKALLVATDGGSVASASVPVASSYPRPGWVEQSPLEIAASVRTAVAQCLVGHDPARVVTVGFSTQRESMVLWDARTGIPVSEVVSWQDQRAVGLCNELLASGVGDVVRERSGLPLDPMFSATRARWLLDAHDPDRTRSRAGRLRLGTVDSWLLSRFSDDHLVEAGNASRTQLLDIENLGWDPELLDIFGVPAAVLGRVVPSVGPFPTTRDLGPLADGTPVGAVLGDSHAALFAHAGWRVGTVKATYGTGSSIMGLCRPDSTIGPGLCRTVAWDDGRGAAYAVEGNIRASGATLSWLARTVARTPGELADLAADAESDGVFVVPAFNGLGAPWWDRDAIGLIVGLTLGTDLAQLARAALESIAFQVEDVLALVDAEVVAVPRLLADGGASANPMLMQLQADISGRIVDRATSTDLSALGAAHLAGEQAGVWTRADLDAMPRPRTRVVPQSGQDERQRRRQAWLTAVARSRPL